MAIGAMSTATVRSFARRVAVAEIVPVQTSVAARKVGKLYEVIASQYAGKDVLEILTVFRPTSAPVFLGLKRLMGFVGLFVSITVETVIALHLRIVDAIEDIF